MSDRYFAFISYASDYRDWVAKLHSDLERCLDHYARKVDPSISRRVFLDQVDLRSGQTWIDQFQKAVDQSERLILVLSPETLTSEKVRIQWQSFFAKRPDDLFPVRIAEVELSGFLEAIQWIDFMGIGGAAYNQRLRQLFGDMLYRSRRDPPPMPEGLSAPSPPEPSYPGTEVRDLSLALKAAYRQRAEVLAEKGDVASLNATIVDLKRQLRAGPQLQAGDCLLEGRFELLEIIGKGGFATVWKAYDQEWHSLVALKVLHSRHSNDKRRRERFFRGARQMSKLWHPGVVSVVEPCCEDEGYFFFVMEYLAGGDFRQAVLEGRLGRRQRLGVILAIGRALSYAHSQGIIHRDVKPANILLDPGGRAKLTDFDLVRAADTTGGTRTAMMGTVVYAAPEAMLDAKQAAEPADVFGLGMTTVFALQGIDLTMDALYEQESLIGKLPLNQAGRKALRRALVRDVEERWGSVEEFCNGLESARLRAPTRAPGRRRSVSPSEDLPGERARDSPSSARADESPTQYQVSYYVSSLIGRILFVPILLTILVVVGWALLILSW